MGRENLKVAIRVKGPSCFAGRRGLLLQSL
jgi:hypothetical protein